MTYASPSNGGLANPTLPGDSCQLNLLTWAKNGRVGADRCNHTGKGAEGDSSVECGRFSTRSRTHWPLAGWYFRRRTAQDVPVFVLPHYGFPPVRQPECGYLTPLESLVDQYGRFLSIVVTNGAAGPPPVRTLIYISVRTGGGGLYGHVLSV
jgi:hypothetical protein